MKKFSNITGQQVSEKPKVVEQVDERKVLKVKMMKLMEQLLSIETLGPIDRFQRFGLIKIKGQEILTEAIISLVENSNIESQTKLLESLKSEIRDWQSIDSKIEKLNNNTKDFKINFKLSKILEKYSDDEVLLLNFIVEKINKLNNNTKKELYLKCIKDSSDISDNIKIKINDIFNAKS